LWGAARLPRGLHRTKDLWEDAPLKIAGSAEGEVKAAESRSYGLDSRIDLIACRGCGSESRTRWDAAAAKGGGNPVLGAVGNRVDRPGECRWGVDASIIIVRLGEWGTARSKIACCGAVRVTAHSRRLTPP